MVRPFANSSKLFYTTNLSPSSMAMDWVLDHSGAHTSKKERKKGKKDDFLLPNKHNNGGLLQRNQLTALQSRAVR